MGEWVHACVRACLRVRVRPVCPVRNATRRTFLLVFFIFLFIIIFRTTKIFLFDFPFLWTIETDADCECAVKCRSLWVDTAFWAHHCMVVLVAVAAADAVNGNEKPNDDELSNNILKRLLARHPIHPVSTWHSSQRQNKKLLRSCYTLNPLLLCPSATDSFDLLKQQQQQQLEIDREQFDQSLLLPL